MGWLWSYTLGSMAMAMIVVRLFEAVTNPFLTAPSKVLRKLLSLFRSGPQ
jgi:hypothetical protein